MATDAPLATVVIRTKNAGDILGQVLAGLRSQDFRDFEVRAVDSGSTDDTVAILDSFGVPHEVIDARSYQPGPVLNRAVERCRTPIVVFLNSDTVPLRADALRLLLAPLQDPNVAGAFARQVARPDAEPWVVRDYEAAFPAEGPSAPWMSFSLPFAAIRRSVWETHHFYDEAWASEDTEWGRWAREAGHLVVYVPEALVMHSHNYTLKQVWGRKFVEGEADAFIYGARPSLVAAVGRALAGGLRDAVAYLKAGNPGGIPLAFLRRAVYHGAWLRGCRLGAERRARGDADASQGQGVVLATY